MCVEERGTAQDHATSYQGMRPYATSVWGLKLLHTYAGEYEVCVLTTADLRRTSVAKLNKRLMDSPNINAQQVLKYLT